MRKIGFYRYSSSEVVIKRSHHYDLMGEDRYQALYIPQDAIYAIKTEPVSALKFADNVNRKMVKICLYVEENVARYIESTTPMNKNEIKKTAKEQLSV